MLNKLVRSGSLKSYVYIDVDEDGTEEQTGEHRNTEQLTLEFQNGEKLVIGTFCSGCSENTCLLFL